MTFPPPDPPPPTPEPPPAAPPAFVPFAATQPPAAQKKPRSGWFWLAVIGGPVLAFILLIAGLIAYSIHSLKGDDDDTTAKFNSSQIGVIDVNGVILTSETINEQLRKFDDDSSIKAIILHIDSPGGSALASAQMHRELELLAREKPLVAAMGNVAIPPGPGRTVVYPFW